MVSLDNLRGRVSNIYTIKYNDIFDGSQQLKKLTNYILPNLKALNYSPLATRYATSFPDDKIISHIATPQDYVLFLKKKGVYQEFEEIVYELTERYKIGK